MHKFQWKFRLKLIHGGGGEGISYLREIIWITVRHKGENYLKHHIFLKIISRWKIAELLDPTRSGCRSSSLNPHHVMLRNKTNIDSTEPGCTASQKMMCILISNSLQYMGPAREEKKVAYKIRHLNPHPKYIYVYYIYYLHDIYI